MGTLYTKIQLPTCSGTHRKNQLRTHAQTHRHTDAQTHAHALHYNIDLKTMEIYERNGNLWKFSVFKENLWNFFHKLGMPYGYVNYVQSL